MEYFLVVFLAFALWHFIYEAILAPSQRLKLRFDLFILRDRVRELKIENPHAFRDKHFHYLQDSINTLVALLARFDIATMERIESEMRKNPELQKCSEERIRTLDDCTLEEAKKIRYQTLRLAFVALALNSGGWFLYVVPPLTIGAIWFGLSSYVSSFKRRIKAVIAIPHSELNKVAPPPGPDLSLGLAG
jgi:hypothetical protein